MHRFIYWGAIFCLGSSLNCGGDPADGQTTRGEITFECPEDSMQACNESTECPNTSDEDIANGAVPQFEVCIDHRCRCAYHRRYEIAILSTNLYARANGGKCWDTGTFDEGQGVWTCDDLPDPYYQLQVDGEFFVSDTQQNTLSAIWSQNIYEVAISPNTRYGFTMFEQDGSKDEIFEGNPFTNRWDDLDIETDGEQDDAVLYQEPIFTFTPTQLQQAGLTIHAPDVGGAGQHSIRLTLTPML